MQPSAKPSYFDHIETEFFKNCLKLHLTLSHVHEKKLAPVITYMKMNQQLLISLIRLKNSTTPCYKLLNTV